MEEMEEMEKKESSALMRDPEGVLTGKKKASIDVFRLKPLYGLIACVHGV